jgi:hypothetical protein
MYGEGAKYNTMEHKFRAWRKTAEVLRATAGEGTAQVQPQVVPRAPRTPNTGGKKTSTPSKSKTAKGSKAADTADSEAVEDTPAPIVDLSGEDVDPIKPEVKLENEITRSLMGIKSYGLDDSDAEDDDEVQVLDEPASKRLKVKLDVDDTPVKLPSFKAERGTRIYSQGNGYDLPKLSSTAFTAADTNANVFANLNTLVRGSEASDPVYGNEV